MPLVPSGNGANLYTAIYDVYILKIKIIKNSQSQTEIKPQLKKPTEQ
jgi:hypothetical protein